MGWSSGGGNRRGVGLGLWDSSWGGGTSWGSGDWWSLGWGLWNRGWSSGLSWGNGSRLRNWSINRDQLHNDIDVIRLIEGNNESTDLVEVTTVAEVVIKTEDILLINVVSWDVDGGGANVVEASRVNLEGNSGSNIRSEGSSESETSLSTEIGTTETTWVKGVGVISTIIS